MGLRFQKRLTVFPGLRLNFSLRGVSATVGPRGASINVGPKGSFLNLGIPGTGLSTRVHLAPQQPDERARRPSPRTERSTAPLPTADLEGTHYISPSVGSLSSPAMVPIQTLLVAATSRRQQLKASLERASKERADSARSLQRLRRSPLARFEQPYLAQLAQHAEVADGVEKTLEDLLRGCVVDVGFEQTDRPAKFDDIATTFDALTRAAAIWDVSRSVAQDRATTRSSASQQIERTPVSFDVTHEEIFASDAPLLQLGNANGGTIILTPAFALIKDREAIDVIDLRYLKIDAAPIRFIEDGNVPHDARALGETWEKVNKDGSPDRRFKDNRTIPVVQYGELSLTTKTGLNERYLVSNADAAIRFSAAIKDYVRSLPTGPPTAETPDDADEMGSDELSLLEADLPELPTRPRRPVAPRAVAAGIGISMLVGSTWAFHNLSLLSTKSRDPHHEGTAAVEPPPQSTSVPAESPKPSPTTAFPDRPLTRDEMAEAQRLLAAQGFSLGPVDGLSGRRTRTAANEMRIRLGWPPANDVDMRLLAALREAQAPPKKPR